MCVCVCVCVFYKVSKASDVLVRTHTHLVPAVPKAHTQACDGRSRWPVPGGLVLSCTKTWRVTARTVAHAKLEWIAELATPIHHVPALSCVITLWTPAIASDVDPCLILLILVRLFGSLGHRTQPTAPHFLRGSSSRGQQTATKVCHPLLLPPVAAAIRCCHNPLLPRTDSTDIC